MSDNLLPVPEESGGVDWEAVERLYRAGQLSLREMGRRAGVSHARIVQVATERGWERDLSARVQAAVTARLTAPLTTATPETEAEIIEQAAAQGASIVIAHRGNAARMRATLDQLQARLAELLDQHKEVEELARQEPNGPAKVALMRALALPEQARTLDKMANTLAKLIPLERQAYGIDDGSHGSAPTAEQQRLRDDAYAVVMGMLADRARAKHDDREAEYLQLAGSSGPRS